jgi:hypothetical protein
MKYLPLVLLFVGESVTIYAEELGTLSLNSSRAIVLAD